MAYFVKAETVMVRRMEGKMLPLAAFSNEDEWYLVFAKALFEEGKRVEVMPGNHVTISVNEPFKKTDSAK